MTGEGDERRRDEDDDLRFRRSERMASLLNELVAAQSVPTTDGNLDTLRAAIAGLPREDLDALAVHLVLREATRRSLQQFEEGGR